MSSFPINLIHAEVLAPHGRSLAIGGAPVEKLFEGCGIPLQAVHDPESLITMRQAHLLMEKAAHYAGEETLGSQVGMDLQLDELGALGFAIQQAPTLYDAGRVVMAAVQVSEPGSRCWIEPHGMESWFCYRPVTRFGAGGAQAEQFDCECLLKFVRLAAGDDWLPRKVRVAKVTADVLGKTQHFAETEVERDDTTTAIAFPSHLLPRPLAGPLPGPGATSSWEVDPIAEASLRISCAVALVLESLCKFEHLPSLETMAERLGMHRRAFQRALADEGTSYRHLTERILFRRAATLLGDQGLSVTSISVELGYSSPSSFVRAFRRIAGVTPLAYRASKDARPQAKPG
jgi:AraC-like DNA-binding protein